jgi:hypothetical protein
MNQTMIPFQPYYFVIEGFDRAKGMIITRVYRERSDAEDKGRAWIYNDADMSNISCFAVDQRFVYEDDGLQLNHSEYFKYQDMRFNDLESAYWENIGR